jgi:cysteine desulfurase
MKRIYFDNAATTPVRKEVIETMKPFFSVKFGNASSLHSFGQEARDALDDSRQRMAKALGAKPEEIIFTSGGTESDNLALKGVAFANKDRGKHIITSKIEHHAILHVCEWLETQGFSITYLPVDKYGLVSPDDLEAAIRKDTILATVMHANNEIGTIEPINELGKICREHGVYFHTDAVQSFGKIPIDMKNIDMLSASAHKIYGPKGVGALFVREGVQIDSLLHGGGHERDMRSGTENIPGIVGFAKAAELAMKEMNSEGKRQSILRDRLIKKTLMINNSSLNGHTSKRLPNNVNVRFSFIEGESLVLMLDDKGIASSTGSACSSTSLEPSHVLLAIGLKHQDADGSLRLTLGRNNTAEEIDYVNETLPDIVEKLRQISPFKKNYEVK